MENITRARENLMFFDALLAIIVKDWCKIARDHIFIKRIKYNK
jgi:hypothetical protein